MLGTCIQSLGRKLWWPGPGIADAGRIIRRDMSQTFRLFRAAALTVIFTTGASVIVPAPAIGWLLVGIGCLALFGWAIEDTQGRDDGR